MGDLRENIIHAHKIGIYNPAQQSNAMNKYKKTILKILNGKVVEKYESLAMASKTMGVTKQSIRRAFKKNGTCCGFHWQII